MYQRQVSFTEAIKMALQRQRPDRQSVWSRAQRRGLSKKNDLHAP